MLLSHERIVGFKAVINGFHHHRCLTLKSQTRRKTFASPFEEPDYNEHFIRGEGFHRNSGSVWSVLLCYCVVEIVRADSAFIRMVISSSSSAKDAFIKMMLIKWLFNSLSSFTVENQAVIFHTVKINVFGSSAECVAGLPAAEESIMVFV